MAKKTSSGSAKRFGSRYGRRVRNKLAEVEGLQRASYKCPYCASQSVKRGSIGIWNCKKCGAKFSGKAYTIEKQKKAKAIEAKAEQEEETSQS